MKYETINDLIRDLDIDKNHWINKEALEFIRERNYRETKSSLKHVPHWLLKKKFQCKKGHTFSPNWLEKRPPVSTFIDRKGMYLRQSSTDIICPICKQKLLLPLPLASLNGEVSVFGDEAFRESGGQTISVYSFVCFSGGDKDKSDFIEKIQALKNKFKIERFHYKDLRSAEKTASISEFIGLINKENESGNLNLYASIDVSGSQSREFERNMLKAHCFSSAMICIVQECTVHNRAPKFFFERTGKDGWAKNFFKGIRLNLAWAVITNGIPVQMPIFIKPNESPFLEIADAVAYLVARKLYQVSERKNKNKVTSHFSPDLLGGIRYIISDEEKNFRKLYLKNIPIEAIFKNSLGEDFFENDEHFNPTLDYEENRFLYIHENNIP